jgi:putative hydrolase of the HAD superfamily
MNELSGVVMKMEEFDHAWNAMLLDIPEERVRLIEQLKKKYRVYLLSNTNQIHYDAYSGILTGYGYPKLDDLFHGAWFSFRMGKIKPDPAIYSEVIEKEGILASETLFIDDLALNVEGAQTAGIAGLCITPGTLTEVFAEFKE